MKAFVYVLMQSTSDRQIALRLWKYMLLLCERHKKNRDKLPLIYPLLLLIYRVFQMMKQKRRSIQVYFEYFLKHIHQRDILKLWDEFLSKFKQNIVIDKELGCVYLKSLLWYTDSKVPEEKQQELEQIIIYRFYINCCVLP